MNEIENKLENVSEELKDNKEKLEESENSFIKLYNKFASANEFLISAENGKSEADGQIEKLITSKVNLEEKVKFLGFKKTISSAIPHFSKILLTKCLFLQLFIGLILGKPFISGMFGFYLLFFWEFTPFFIITTAISTWSYSLTKRIYIGAMLNALLFSWTLASILTLAI